MVVQKMKRMIKITGKNLGNVNCLTLFVPLGTRNIVVFFRAKTYSH